MRSTRLALFLAALAGLGCGDDLGPVWVELGQGETHHAVLADGDEVEIVEGPQGGTMIALSLAAGGVQAGDPADPTDPDNPRVTFQAFGASDSTRAVPFGSITVVRGLQANSDGDVELAGTWLIFDAALDEAQFFDQPLLVDLRIVDALGNEAEDSAEIFATAPERR